MYNYRHRKHFVVAARVALAICALTAVGSRTVQAQATATKVTTQAQLGAFTFTAPNYAGPGIGQVPSPYVTTAGPTTITLTDQNGGVFSRDNVTATSGIDFAAGTTLLQTADARNVPLGPLQIDFTTLGTPIGVSGFGVTVQNFAFDQETFTLQVFTNGSTAANPLNTFTFGPFDNATGIGHSVFVGALSTFGNTITRAVISSTSTVGGVDTGFGNNFYFNPVTVSSAPAVPEASTVVGFGIGALLLAGMAVGARKRKASRAQYSAY